MDKQAFNYNDGGRAAAGYRGNTGDCVVRAIAIATGKPYKEVYNALWAGGIFFKETSRTSVAKRMSDKTTSPRNGVNRRVYHPYLLSLGMVWTPTMFIGQGCRVHLQADELPGGILIVRVSKHLTTMVDGVINDTFNPQRGGSFYAILNGVKTRGTTPQRCVYGYYSFPKTTNTNNRE